MKLMIRETGEIKSLSLVDEHTQQDYATDWILNNGAYTEYEPALGLWLMSDADFDMWHARINKASTNRKPTR